MYLVQFLFALYLLPALTTTSCNETTCTPNESSARYRLTFNATWSATTHPTDFPSNPHFSGLIGTTHNSNMRLWAAGGFAGAGIENMAETGSKEPLATEIKALQASGADETISGSGISVSPGSVSVDFTINDSATLVSVVSMLAPSPDWFVGVDSTDLCESDAWVNEKSATLYAYDAGTDSGNTFTAADDDTDPQEEIERLEESPFVVNGELRQVGTFTFTKI